MSKKIEQKDELENVQHALTTSEAFIEKYQKQILYVVGVVVLLVISVLAVRNYYLKPREKEASFEMYKAQTYFNVDSFQVALNGKLPECIGFKEIVSEYGITSSGNLASAYAGICYFKLGEYDNAIKYLSQFDGKDENVSVTVTGLIGDSYIEKGEVKKAISYFEKAAGADNQVLSPIYLKKAAVAYESLNQPQKALDNYNKIKEKYPQSTVASDIDKYIARLSN